MKKLVLVGLATVAMLTSCSNDETVEMPQSKAIGFSNAFVNNGTRSIDDPSLTKKTLGSFAVYGFTQNGQIFDGTIVSRRDEGTIWTYNPLQYWIAGNIYTFSAIAPADITVTNESVVDGKVRMTVPFTNDGVTDLLHAAPAQITDVTETYSTPVSMTFNHQLSKVKFSFENAVGDGYNVKVTNVRIDDAKQSGVLTIGAENIWSAQSGSVELVFGNVTAADATAAEATAIANGESLECYSEKLMIPTGKDVAYKVIFNVELFQGEVSMGNNYEHIVEIKDVEFKLGYCYDFKAILTHENIAGPDKPLIPIVFEVAEVNPWNSDEIEQTLDVPTTQQGN